MNWLLDHFNTLFSSYADLVYDEKHFFLKVVDTPGILDHSLEERNTIEMQVRYIQNLSLPYATFLPPNFFLEIQNFCEQSIHSRFFNFWIR